MWIFKTFALIKKLFKLFSHVLGFKYPVGENYLFSCFLSLLN